MKAAIYTRISKNPSKDEAGVRRQEKECRELAQRHCHDVVAVFADDDRTAYSRKRRPGYEQLLQTLHEVDVVVAWHPDRLTRHPRELEDLIDALEANATTVHTVQTGPYDLSTPSGRMIARQLGAVARYESEHKSARLRSKHRELAEQGRLGSGGGERAYGYERDRLTVVPHEAAVIREIADRALAGESMQAITRDLNTRGIRTGTGRQWYPSAIARVLCNPRIAGLRRHRGVVTAVAEWPPIIDSGTHRRLLALLSDRTRNKVVGAHGRQPKLLTGHLRCSACGAPMKATPRTGGIAAYGCKRAPGYRGCGRTSILAGPLEELVAEAVVERLGDDVARRSATPPLDDSADLAELNRIDDRRRELAEMWGAGELQRADWAAATVALDRRQAEVEARLRDHVRDTGPLELIAAEGAEGVAWEDLLIGRQRAILSALIERIDILPAVRGRGRFDAGRVSIEWRA